MSLQHVQFWKPGNRLRERATWETQSWSRSAGHTLEKANWLPSCVMRSILLGRMKKPGSSSLPHKTGFLRSQIICFLSPKGVLVNRGRQWRWAHYINMVISFQLTILQRHFKFSTSIKVLLSTTLGCIDTTMGRSVLAPLKQLVMLDNYSPV